MKHDIPTEPPLVFISYNKTDNEIAREIAMFLAAEGITVWYGEWEISPGDSIVEEINKGLHGCTHFIILWSVNSAKSKWVKRELQSTLAKAIQEGSSPKVLPVIIDDTPLPALLSDIHYIKYQGGNEEDRRMIVEAVTEHPPSLNFIRAVVKKYKELIFTSCGLENPYGVAACPGCGSIRVKYSFIQFGDHDLLSLNCEECGWSEG